jgi:hypothetical protein
MAQVFLNSAFNEDISVWNPVASDDFDWMFGASFYQVCAGNIACLFSLVFTSGDLVLTTPVLLPPRIFVHGALG